MKSLLSTGEFAKLVNTTKRTIIHYNNMGVLLPRTVSSDGNRSYTNDQLTNFYLITNLQQADISLESIRQDLTNNQYSYKKLFKKYSTKLKSVIQNATKAYNLMENKFNPVKNLLSDFEPVFMQGFNNFSCNTYTDTTELFEILDATVKKASFNKAIWFFEISTNYIFGANTKENIKWGFISDSTKTISPLLKSEIKSSKALKKTYFLTKTNLEKVIDDLKRASQEYFPSPRSILVKLHDPDLNKKIVLEVFIKL